MATEKRLKDANALKAIFDERYDDAVMQSLTRPNIAWWEGYSAGVNWGRNTIADVPTVDAVEVVHSRFVRIADFGDGEGCFGHCEKCGTVHHSQSPVALKADYRWCRWCGAKMDGDGNG